MAQKYEHIDLNTLQEIERLLTSTDFATAEDLASRGIRSQHLTSAGSGGRSSDTLAGNEGLAPLPKRG
jgi:hypothetical protein